MDITMGEHGNRQALLQDLAKESTFDKKWDILKPVMMKLYLEEHRTLEEVMDHLRTEYGFIAQESSYKYHINRKWKWKRNLPISKTGALILKREKRAEVGKSTIFVDKNGKPIPVDKLRRQAKELIRRESAMEHIMTRDMHNLRVLSGSSFVLGDSLFLNWYMPFGTMYISANRAASQSAPSPMTTSTPSDIVATTPSNVAHSPSNAPSPLTVYQNNRKNIQRAHMFLGGRYEDLLGKMKTEEKEIMSKWLYQFWFYAFKTAKHWGRGPRYWDSKNLGFDTLRPADEVSTMATPPLASKPISLCRWSIHCKAMRYEEVSSPDPDEDPVDQQTWNEWPKSWKEKPSGEELLNGLSNNVFSSLPATELPIAIPQIVKSLKVSPGGLQPEMFAFAVVSRNQDLLEKLEYDLIGLLASEKVKFLEQLKSLNLVHLATIYLDGSKTCCGILNQVLQICWSFRLHHVNNLGHTVLDSLMLTILKAHTSIAPGTVDDALTNEPRFPGEEADICGRFDADSDCVRDLTAKGIVQIPFSWKHKFCHTSVQAICHSIEQLCLYSRGIGDFEWLKNSTSGLFTKRCESCGLVMRLGCLHAVVMTAYLLAQFGATDEDLFGILAVSMCLLRNGFDPLMEAFIAPSVLLDGEDENFPEMSCRHQTLTAADFMECVPLQTILRWSEQKKVCWNVSLRVLRRAEIAQQTPKLNQVFINDNSDISDKSLMGNEDNDMFVGETMDNTRFAKSYRCVHEDEYQDDEYQEEDEYQEDEYKRRGFNSLVTDPQLATISAAIQAELLTYRRVKEGDSWLSPNFDMHTLLSDLTDNSSISIGLVKRGMLKAICACGRFESVGYYQCAYIEDVSRFHFSNLEDWSRSTFIAD